MVSVKIPATSANMGAGFDCMGFAVSLYNELHIEKHAEAVRGSGAEPLSAFRILAY
jgi:homoserine kinase